MNSLDPVHTSSPPSLLDDVTQIASDTTGVQTFSRYLWQAKQAVRQWLTSLSEASGPQVVICEHVEDIVLVFKDHLRFLQLKTRDRGSWSASIMCEEGLDSLCRAYKWTRDAGVHVIAKFELWLEGPISDRNETVVFVTDPTKATPAIRTKLLANNADPDWIDDFLARLVIRPDQPPRAHIDAIVIREISCIWPSLSKPELDSLYSMLLQAATTAQGAESHPTFASIVANMMISSDHHVHGLSASTPELQPLRPQMLFPQDLRTAAPPLRNDLPAQILARIGHGTEASMLELKMTIAGATQQTIQQAQALRAQMELKRQELLALKDDAEQCLEKLAQRVLTVADATARAIYMSAVANPVAASRPAEAITAQLLSNLGNLAGLDNEQLFQQDALAIYGFLGHLSDECRYPWKVA